MLFDWVFHGVDDQASIVFPIDIHGFVFHPVAGIDPPGLLLNLEQKGINLPGFLNFYVCVAAQGTLVAVDHLGTVGSAGGLNCFDHSFIAEISNQQCEEKDVTDGQNHQSG